MSASESSVADHGPTTDDAAEDVADRGDDAIVKPALDEPGRSWRVTATMFVVLPFLTAVIRALRNDWFPIGDNALFAVRARDVWTEDHPFLGAWTSASLSVGENMNNPGALYDWLIAPFAHLLSPGPAVAIGVAMVNVAMIIAISAVAHRIGGWPLQRLALLAVGVLAWSMGSELLIDMWQANALIFTFMLVLLLAVAIATGDHALLPAAAFVVSLLLQTHISYAYVFIALVAGVIGASVWLRPVPVSDWRRPVAMAVGLLGVLWAPSLWEQLFGTDKGNLARLLGNSSGGDLSLGLTDATRIVGSVAALPPWWGRSGYTTTVPVTRLADDGRSIDIVGLAPLWATAIGILVLGALLVVATVACRRRGLDVQAGAGAIACTLLLGSVVALSRLTIGSVGLSPHHVRWVWPLIAFVHLTLLWLAMSIWAASGRALQARQRTGAVVVAIMVFVTIANFPFRAQPSGPVFEYGSMPTMRRIKPSIERLDGFGPVLYDVTTLRIFEPYSFTMMMWMQERGIEFRVDDEIAIRHLGEPRRSDGTERTFVFQLQGADARTYSGPGCVLGVASTLSSADDEAVDAMVERAAAALAMTSDEQPGDVYDQIVRREVDASMVLDDSAAFDQWVDTSYALLADGEACHT